MTLSEEGYAVVRDAVNLARNEQIASISMLRTRLIQYAHTDKAIKEGLLYWAAEERKS